MSNATHAFLPPSGAGNWVACAQWPMAQRDNPQGPASESSEQGTLGHAALVAVLQGSHEPDGLDEELRRSVAGMVDYVRSLPVDAWEIEKAVRGKGHSHPENWGTPDLYGWDGMTLHVVEAKFGHAFVDHVRNWQLTNYTKLILDGVIADGLVEAKIDVVHHVMQPHYYRAAPYRHWKTTAVDLRGAFNIIDNAANAATRGDRKATTGPQCLHCRGRATCPSFVASVTSVIDYSKQAGTTLPGPSAVGAELTLVSEALERLKAMQTALSSQVEYHASKGEQVPGWEFTRGESRLKWKSSQQEVVALGQMFGVNLETTGLITPTQAITKGIPTELVSSMAARTAGELKLTKTDPNRAFEAFTK